MIYFKDISQFHDLNLASVKFICPLITLFLIYENLLLFSNFNKLKYSSHTVNYDFLE